MSAYPEDLASVSKSARVPEAFGWSLLSWACILIVWGSVLFTQPAKPARSEYITAAIAFWFALFLIFFEFRRRKKTRVLVRLPDAPEIGIYRSGLLIRTVQV